MSIGSPSEVPVGRVEPPYLVISTMTALPKRCIKTNQTVGDAEYHVWNLPVVTDGMIVFIFLFLGPGVLLLTPFFRTRCKIKAGLSNAVRRKRLAVRLGAVLLPLVMIGSAILTGSGVLAALGALTGVVAYLSIPLFVLNAKPLRVRKRSGDVFWITGFSECFLKQLQAESHSASEIVSDH